MFPDRNFPPHENHCVCNHPISLNFYIYNPNTDHFLVIGSECINQFTEGKIRRCKVCNEPHKRTKTNICNNCDYLQITKIFKKNKIDNEGFNKCLDKTGLLTNEEIETWNKYPQFEINGYILIDNLEDLKKYINIKLKICNEYCPIDCDYKNEHIEQYDITNIIKNSNYNIREKIKIEYLDEREKIKIEYLDEKFSDFKNKDYGLRKYEYEYEGERFITYIPTGIYDSSYYNLDEYYIKKGFIYLTYKKFGTYECKD